MSGTNESPFGPSPLDEEPIRHVDPAVDAIDALSDAEAEAALAAMLLAVEEKRKASGIKAALKSVVEFVRPYLPIPK